MSEVIFGTSKKVTITMEGGGNTETVGEGVLYIRSTSKGYQFDLRADPGIMMKGFYQGFGAAYTAWEHKDEMLVLAAGAAWKGIAGALTHTDLSRVKNPYKAYGFQGDMERLKEVGYLLDESTESLWTMKLKRITRLERDGKFVLVQTARNNRFYRINFRSRGEAERWYNKLRTLLHMQPL